MVPRTRERRSNSMKSFASSLAHPREYVRESPRRTRMRTALLPFALVFAAACSTSTSGGAANLSFGPPGATSVGVFTTTPAGAAMIQGEFSATGDYEGEYTLTTSIPQGSPLATCLISVDGGTPSASVQVDASTSQTHTLTVEIGVAADYQGQALCNVAAMNDAKTNVGNEVIIQVSEATGDAG
jgi:hypothetical protein